MQRFLTRRFEIERVLRRSKYVTSFVGHDRWTDRREVFVKCIPGRVCQISAGFEKRLAWYRSIAHPRMGNVVEAGFTPGKDFYYSSSAFQAGSVRYRRDLRSGSHGIEALHILGWEMLLKPDSRRERTSTTSGTTILHRQKVFSTGRTQAQSPQDWLGPACCYRPTESFTEGSNPQTF